MKNKTKANPKKKLVAVPPALGSIVTSKGTEVNSAPLADEKD